MCQVTFLAEDYTSAIPVISDETARSEVTTQRLCLEWERSGHQDTGGVQGSTAAMATGEGHIKFPQQ